MKSQMGIYYFLSFAIIAISCSFGDPVLPNGISQNSILLPPGQKPTISPDDNQNGPGTAGIPAEERTSDTLPYQIDFDTVAYMNCPGDAQPNDPVFFTFRFGAYGSGLKLSPDFAETLKHLNSSEKRLKLTSSPLINSRAQLSLSQTGSPGQIARIGQSTDVVDVLALNNTSALEYLIRDGVSYKLGHNASVELDLLYPGNSLFNLFPSLDTELTVYLTYNRGDSPENFQPLSPGEGVHYGSYFNFDFNSNSDSLTRVKEFNLLNNRSRGNWECPENLRFAIHRDNQFTRDLYFNNENNRKYFNENDLSVEWECQEDASVLQGWEPGLFNSLIKNRTFVYGRTLEWDRNSDGENQWTLTDKKCIRPTRPEFNCYAGNTVRVEFNEVNCSVSSDNTKVCPSYLSICVNSAAKSGN